MKLTNIVIIAASGVICGCDTIGVGGGGATDGGEADAKDIVAEIAKIDSEDGRDMVQTVTVSDENFAYTMGDEHTRAFKRINDKATLNDLNDFAYAKCWNGYLRPKLQNGQKLTREDAVLLDFCVNVQLNMVDTLAVAAFGDMTDPGFLHSFVVKAAEKSRHSNDLEGIYKAQNDVFSDLKMNFINSNEGIRVPMRQWASEFNIVPRDVMQRVFGDVVKATGASDHSDGSYRKDHPWLWAGKWALVLAGGGLVGGGAWYATTPPYPNEVEKGSMLLQTPVVTMKNEWVNARNEMTVYLQEMFKMREELQSMRSGSYQQDPQTRKFLQHILSESDNDHTAVAQYLDYAMYDVPFSVLTYKAIGELKNCKGRVNDDEEKMMHVMSEYCQAVSGTDMLKRLRTRYAANGYIEAVRRLKDELSDQEFKDFVHESKLYNVDQKVDRMGRPQNDVQPIDPGK